MLLLQDVLRQTVNVAYGMAKYVWNDEVSKNLI